MKKIENLTEKEAEKILEFVLKGKFKKYGWLFDKIYFEPSEPGRVTFGLRPMIGIGYKADLNWDGFILHFDDTKCVQWLYEHGYDIGEQLKMNSYMSEQETNFENFVFELEYLYKNPAGKWIENFCLKLDKIKELTKKYYYKDY